MLKLAQRKHRNQGNHPVHLAKPKRVLPRTEVEKNPLALQQQVFGNQVVLRFARSCPLGLQSPKFCPFGGACHSCPARVQAKLVVGQPNDKYEQEADRIADQVMAMPEPKARQRGLVAGQAEGIGLQRQSEEEEEEAVQAKPVASQITPLVQRQVKPEEEEEESVQAKAGTGEMPVVSRGLQTKIEGLRGGGQPLSKSVRAFFEPRFGCDFSGVRVHTDARATEAARAINARAFTLRNNIVFGVGHYSPETVTGQRLLAHELTHVVQQGYNPNTSDSFSMLQLSCIPGREVWGGFQIASTDKTFLSKVKSDLEKINKLSQGRGLLDEIKKNRSPFYRKRIMIDRGNTICGYKDLILTYKPDKCLEKNVCPNLRGKKYTNWHQVPNYVYLFHEIVHAYLRLIKGLKDDKLSECMAVGLGKYFKSIKYNENKLRCELGLKIRPCYYSGSYCKGLKPPVCSKPSTKKDTV